MTPNTFSVRFVIRTDRIDIEGSAPIYALITINGERIHLSINHKIKPKNWLTKQAIAKNNSKANQEINTAIESFKSRIYNAYSNLLSKNKPLTAEELKNELFGETKIEKSKTLIEVATEHNLHFEKMIGIKYSYGSYKNYKTTLKYIKEFIPEFYGKKDISLMEVKYKFAEEFFSFLTTRKTCKQNGANKQIQRLKKILNFAINHGYLQQSQMSGYKLNFTPVNKIALTQQEINSIERLDLQRDVLKRVKDVFLLQCYTGLSYADIKALKPSNIHLRNENNYMIIMQRAKTKISFTVPLLEPAQRIIEQYTSLEGSLDTPIMKVISNQKMNDNLKIIQELAGISKNLTTHLARHTFATTITLGNGVPIETVSRMLGHTKLSTTQLYAKVLDHKIISDMDILKEKINKEKDRD